MLKTFRGLALGLVVLVGSAYVTPTYASSTSVIITEVQAGTLSRAHEEYVALYNPGPETIDITDWCLTNKSEKEFACFDAPGPNEAFLIYPNSYALVFSEYKASITYDQFAYSMVYYGASLTTSSITASSDTISLLDHNEETVDSVSWSKSLPSQNIYSRIKQAEAEGGAYIDTDSELDWQVDLPTSLPSPLGAFVVIVEDATDPGDEFEPPPPPRHFRLNEIFPNPSGPDAGKEYIELYNPTDTAQPLAGHSLRVGKSLEKTIVLPEIDVESGQYVVIQNDTYDFSLLNTNNRVALFYGSSIVEEVSYSNPRDDMSWSLVDTVWQYTNQPTPGAENKASLLATPAPKSTVKSDPKPCASNQYRSPETNRCRLINPSTTKSTQKPCASNQYRNPETGRCKLISSGSATGPKPCKEGQERNPETNRCRNIKKMSTVDYGVLGAKTESNPEEVLHMWILGAIVVLGVGAYAIWEWREDIKQIAKEVAMKFARRRN